MKFKSLLLCSTACVFLQSALAGETVRAIEAATVTAATAADASRTCQQAANAVVTLYAGAEIGAGSIINADGTILTAYHVVKEAVSQPGKVKIYVKLANGQRSIGQAIASDTRNDLALVQMPAQETLATLPLANASLQRGQAVCAIGSPSGRTGVLSRGAFKAVLANGDLQSAVRLTYGNSGGPLLNAQGALVGVNKAIWLSDRGENTGISYATSVQTAQTFIAKHRSLPSGTVTQPTSASTVASSIIAPLVKKSQIGASQSSTTALSRLGVSWMLRICWYNK